MLERFFAGLKKTENNKIEVGIDKTKLVRRKSVELKLADKHEPFGAISAEKIKRVLEEENFSELQSLYYFMMRDLKVASTVLARRTPLLGLEHTVVGDNLKFIEWLKTSVNLEELVNQLSFAVYYGVSLIDVRYSVADGKLVPDFKLVSPRYLRAHRNKVLKTTLEHLYIKQGDKKLLINKLDPDKRIFHKHPIDIGEITDFSLASKLVWYFSLKHLALAHNMQYFDNVATPPLIVKTSSDNEDALVDTMYGLRSSCMGVFGKDDIVEYLNVTSRADFLRFTEYIDRQIATLVLGNTLSTGEGSKGSYSQSKVHENRQLEVLGFDTRLIAKTVTDYLNRLERLNFANPKGVIFSFNLKVKKDLKELSEVVKNLSDSGYELDQEDVETQLGFKITGKKEPKTQADNSILPQPGILTPGSISSNSQQNQGKAHDILDTKQPNTGNLEKALVRHIETLLEDANSYDEAHNALLDAYPQFPIDELEAALFKAVANSALLAEAEPE